MAQYRRRLDGGEDVNPTELLQALIAEIESERGESEPPKDRAASRG